MNSENLNLLYEILKSIKENKSEKSIYLTERLLYLTLEYFEESSKKDELSYNFSDLSSEFIKTINEQTINYFNKNPHDEKIKLITKSVDFLLNTNVSKYFSEIRKYNELKNLTFNNLSIIYRQIGYFNLALKAVTYVLDIQEKTNIDDINSVKSIISTYLNKSVILSELKQHDKAIITIKKAINFIETYLKFIQLDKDNINSEENFNNYCYLRMVSFFNLAVEYEYSNFKEDSISNYKIAKNLANELKNNDIIEKCNKALKKLSK